MLYRSLNLGTVGCSSSPFRLLKSMVCGPSRLGCGFFRASTSSVARNSAKVALSRNTFAERKATLTISVPRHEKWQLCAARTLGGVAVILLFAANIAAQERFELSAPEIGVSSQATLSANELQVVSQSGVVTSYLRDSRYDSQDGQWVGYVSPGAQQVIRWPVSNRGPMQIGELRGKQVVYRPSQMTIQPVTGMLERVVERPVLPPDMLGQSGSLQPSDFLSQVLAGSLAAGMVEPRSLQIATLDDRNLPTLLNRGSAFDLRTTSNVSDASDWWFAPAGTGYVRMQTYRDGRIYAIGAQTASHAILMPLSQDPRQLWRVAGAGRVANRFLLENVQYPGACLTHVGGRVVLQPINFAPTQLWVPLIPPSLPVLQPLYRTVSHDIRANAPLPAAQLELFNSHRNALIVLLGDNRAGAAVQQIRIEPNSAQVVVLERDAGSTIMETVEIRSALGGWDRQQFVTAVPPSTFYDLSVYEEHLQSIAIDRTGKSPQPIEDINLVPKSVGWIALPPSALPERSRLDVYSRAQSSHNPGAVRRLDPQQFDKIPQQSDRLDAVLQEFQTPATAPRRQF